MSQQASLPAERRTEKGKGAARKLRSRGRVPAVIYGGTDEPESLSLDGKQTEHLFRSISVENTIVEVTIEGEKLGVQTLVREVQAHPFRPEILHVDFLRIQKGVKVELDIPVHLEGIPVGVKHGGGVLEQLIHSLPIRCIPSLIPEESRLDVTALEIGDSLHVSDLPLEEGVEVLMDPERTVCTVGAPRAVVEAEDEDADEDADEVEVIGEEAEDDEASR